ncbi:hypothetical protein EXIGLDRAFT_769953 [Exidia glandulosa HHB12029]|uniref:F-box domain-containing protein n=1 Tax=Exidia glandulosa HHB12029 TaxID=1314781 RepID=A0A165H3Z0_EXIGL|nr:hypothetical protein EXIGLDRAFT_769953 [Exidia glandulosa HHB12029]
MSLRWHKLPVEIVLFIVAHAAGSALADNVPWITQLSLVSRAIYDVVTPVLYATLIVTDTNGSLVRAVTKNPRLMACVRKVCIAAPWNSSPWQWYEVPSLDENGFAGVNEVIFLSNRSIPSFLRPSRLDMHNIPGLNIACFRLKGPLHLFPELTHVYLACPPMAVARIFGLPESLRQLPKLTHLAMDMSRESESLDPPSDTAFSERMGKMLSVILETTDGRLEVLALRVAGPMLARWDSVVRVVTGMHDRRLRVWRDDRTGNTTFLRVHDARIGRDVWTEAKQL